MHVLAPLVVAVYAALLWLPGLVFGRLAGLRGWTLAATSPLLVYGVVGSAGPAFAAAGVRWDPAAVGLLAVAVALVLAAVRWAALRRPGAAPERRSGAATAVLRRLGRRLTGRPPTPADVGWSRAVNLRVVAALVVIAAFGAGVIWVGIGRLASVPQDWDAAFHANGIRYIADTGDSSLTGMGKINWFEDDVQIFYPNAYHLMGALVLRLTGVDVPTVLNAQTVLLPGIGALVIVALVHRFGGRAVLAVAAATCAVAITTFYDLLWRGPLLPFTTGAVLMPLAVVLVLDLLDARDRRSRVRTGLLFAVGLVGMICLNPAILFSAVLFALPAIVARWLEQPRRLRSEPLVVVLAGLGAGLLALPQLLAALGSAAGEPFNWPADLTPLQSIKSLVTLAHDGPLTPRHERARPEWAITAAVAIGVVLLRSLGRLRWIVASGAIFAVLFLFSASSDALWVDTVTRPWWNDRWRFIGLCVVPIAVVAGHGLAELQRLLAGRLAASDRLGRRPALLAAALVAVLFLGVSQGLYAGQNSSRMRLGATDGPVVSEQEREAMRVLATVVPPGQRVLNDRGDGSAWMYAIAGVLPVAGHYNASLIGPDATLLAERFREYPSDAGVRAAVARLGVQYVMIDRGFVRDDFRRQPGLRGLEGARWLEVVYRNQDAVIYRIRPPEPRRP